VEAQDIFITIATDRPEEPYQRVNLQAFADAVSGTVMDLKGQVSEVQRWAGLTDELSKSVLRLQQTFDRLTADLHGATTVATAIMRGPKPKPGGMN
jgi:hypothetical protein